jgi:hypothetical protein
MLPSVFKTCIPREEILAGELSPELFAAKLRLVVEGKAPQVYQDPTAFFANTFATDGLKTLTLFYHSRQSIIKGDRKNTRQRVWLSLAHLHPQ